MSTIKSSTTTTTAYQVVADTTGTLVIQTGSTPTTAVTVDASQNVGIGTSSPSTYGSGGGNLAVVGNNGSGTFYGLGISNSPDTVGNGAGIQFYQGVNVTNRIRSFYSSGWQLRFGSNSADLMTLDSSGNLLVGTTNTAPTAGVGIKNIYSATDPYLSIVGAGSTSATNGLLIYSTGASAYRFYVGMDGRVNATLTTISAISDERLKENIRDLNFGIAEILALKPRRYDWKEGKGANTKNAVGFIAQEFETVFPECVGTSLAGEDGIEYKNINHESLIPTLVKAIQEQQAIIQTLTDRITALENK